MSRSRCRPRRRWFRRAVVIATALVLFGAGFLAWAYATTPLPAEDPLVQTSFVCPATTQVCGPDTAIARFTAGEDRVIVGWDDLPDVLVAAVVAAEDRSFFAHDGIDPGAIARAAVEDVRRGSFAQGGSTITQQYVKNVHLTSERTWRRKLSEAVLAVKLERELSKQEILTRYLNTVYFGRGTYGVEAAAQAYFGHSVREVDLAEAALLAALIRSPETTDPAIDVATAQRRRASVLDAMAEVGLIDAVAAAEAEATPLGEPFVISRQERDSSGVIIDPDVAAAHFVEAVRQEVVERFGAATYTGGLRIHTTLDPGLQTAAVTAVSSALPDAVDPDAAVVIIDDDGAVRALVGGRDYDVSQVDLARGAEGGGSGRQAGSLFKPLVLVAALEQGHHLDEVRPAPSSILLDDWTVSNSDDEDHGEVDLVTATAESLNTTYAALGVEVGADSVVEVAGRVGIESPMPAVASLALGTAEVSPLEMAVAYRTLTDGFRVGPHLVTRVESADGDVLWSSELERERVLSEAVVADVGVALRAVVEHGTGRAASAVTGAIGKTGTTQNRRDAWFAGSACGHTAAVWVGHDDQTAMVDIGGGGVPTRIWAEILGPRC